MTLSTLSPTETHPETTRYVVLLLNDLPPATLFTDDRETRLETIEVANVLANDAYEAMTLATKAAIMDDFRPLAALTSDDLRAMAEKLERVPFTDSRVDYSRKGPTAAELKRVAVNARQQEAPLW